MSDVPIQTGPPKPLKGLRREVDPQRAEDYVQRSKARDRTHALHFLLWLFTGCVGLTFLILILQGFKVWGFSLPEDFLRWLGGAVIAEVAAILGAVVTSLFKE